MAAISGFITSGCILTSSLSSYYTMWKLLENTAFRLLVVLFLKWVWVQWHCPCSCRLWKEVKFTWSSS
jgi:hypothetical protein